MITGFSKLNRQEKIDLLKQSALLKDIHVEAMDSFQSINTATQDIINELSENSISNYALPFGIAPNFLINDKFYYVPMVTEESSVVAAASYAAKFWAENRGFHCNVISTQKSGQIYFSWDGNIQKIIDDFQIIKKKLLEAASSLTSNMVKRGGGITSIQLGKENKSNYYTINVDFETVDSMGANLINSCLEVMGKELINFIKKKYPRGNSEPEIIMAILSNYTPDCLVECMVECEISKLSQISGTLSPQQFADRFEKAVQIAHENTSRAVTHNKGIFNGIDAVLIATGNDFRSAEANAHAYASQDGHYKALTHTKIAKDMFRLVLRMPLALGTVGGATAVHPLAKLALNIMQNPTAKELMQIVAAAGLASNFAAIRSLVTDGIQKGHMKLHLNNILHQLNASDTAKSKARTYFSDKQVSFKSVADYLENIHQQA